MAYISFQPKDYYSTVLYTGTGATRTVTGVGFQPDFTWIKQRDGTYYQQLYDSARGAGYHLASNDTAAQSALDTAGLSAWTADGFTVNTRAQVNYNTGTFTSWNWKGGTTSGITTDGSTTITPSAYSFSATSGISIVQYSGNNTSGAKVAHGLGAAPGMIIVKTINTANSWNIYQQAVDATAPEDYYMTFGTDARTDDSSRWNDTAPDSVNFTLGNAAAVNGSSNTMIAYCFAEKKGFSKFGIYTGNSNADGTFIYTGFRPAYFLIKSTTNAGEPWLVWNNKTEGSNAAGSATTGNNRLTVSSTAAEDSTNELDIVSNGIKIRNASGHVNSSSQTYMYMAFAEFPFVSSNSKATVAR